jgi:hypothetical protein
MITALTKAALENLWHSQRACADCTSTPLSVPERCWQGEARPALRRKSFPKGLHSIITTLCKFYNSIICSIP